MADEEEVQALPLTPDMVSSGLSQIARTLDGLSYAYVRLSIAGKGVTELGSTLTKFEHLRYIDASKNRLGEADSLASLKGLLFVDLRHNALTRVPKFANPYLQVVRLANNKVRSLDGVEAPALTMINLDGTWWPGWPGSGCCSPWMGQRVTRGRRRQRAGLAGRVRRAEAAGEAGGQEEPNQVHQGRGPVPAAA